MGRKAGKTKAKGGPQRYRQSCPGGLIILPHRTPCQPARAAETDEGTGHKHQHQPQDDFIVGKTVHEQQQNEEAGKPDFQDGQAKQPPGTPSEPGTDTGPKSDDGQGPKKDAENTVHAYLPVKDEARSLVLPLRSGTAVPQESGGELRETGQGDNGCPDTAIPEKGVQENTPQSSWGELRRPGKQRAACGLFSVAASPTAFFPLPASSGAPPASTHRQNRKRPRPSVSAAPKRTAHSRHGMS